MAKKKTVIVDVSTEEKIRAAARKVFTQKGYAATRTRDIADEAGINLALLNYYFRSKEKLFALIMLEKIQMLFGLLLPIVNNEQLSLDKKIELIVASYIDMLTEHPDLPIFVLNEMKKPSVEFEQTFPVKNILLQSSLVKQLKEKRPDVEPVHFLLNILGMTIFPFVVKPAFIHLGIMQQQSFNKLVQERKEMIPQWVKAILKSK